MLHVGFTISSMNEDITIMDAEMSQSSGLYDINEEVAVPTFFSVHLFSCLSQGFSVVRL